jgi:hypothetical protein
MRLFIVLRCCACLLASSFALNPGEDSFFDEHADVIIATLDAVDFDGE